MSVGVLVSGLVISWTGWTVVDPIVGLAVAGVIVASVWSLTRDSLRLSLDGVPGGIDIAEIERKMEAVPGVRAVHHIHVWAISTTENALTAHVVLDSLSRMEEVKHALKELLGRSGNPSCDARIRVRHGTMLRFARLNCIVGRNRLIKRLNSGLKHWGRSWFFQKSVQSLSSEE